MLKKLASCITVLEAESDFPGIVWFYGKYKYRGDKYRVPSQVSDLCNPLFSVQHAAGLGAAVP